MKNEKIANVIQKAGAICGERLVPLKSIDTSLHCQAQAASTACKDMFEG